ncbi:DUF4232 domain-containing protein [Actinospica sp.]|jgi:hypothetical protein|uniref:DUF4232 domain-containing protein n=1 Tax=Actinospica sp. TaxID=1872142 RepID=UPI002CA6F0F9|nr:DUF4232 domain-containing protein [Actinospica sp.]HWG28547.1 DUF4232 domain-containing protein [Actinospica sp.]
MSSRIFHKATAAGTLLLGAAALGGCASNGSTGASAGSTQSATVVTSTGAGSTGGTSSTATAGGGTSTQAAGGGTAGCTGSQLSLKINQGSSGMGHTGSVLVFTNTGSTACTLYGYPGADVTENGSYNFSPRMNATRVSGGTAVKTVTLAPGSSASAMLEWSVNPTGGGTANAANCPGMDGGYLEVTPPNTKDTIKSDPPVDMCTDLQVFPVVAGASGQ